MKFNCPECDERLQCDDELAGRVVKCPHCNARLAIPDAPEADDTEQSAAPGADGRPPQAKRLVGTSARARTPLSASRKRSQNWTDGTNVSMLGSGAIGLGLTLLYYLLMLPIRGLYLGELFLKRGWVPYVLVLLMGWSIGFLILKSRKLASQKNALLLDLLPASIAEEIDEDTVDAFLEHVNMMPTRMRSSFMVKRIRKGLEHFSVRHSNPEVVNMMTSQSDIDAGAVHSSYSVVKVFIWAIPILGFIGTVLGISNAVGGFSGALDQAQDIEVLKTSLNGVTSGLAVAFDTTLVALVMSLLVSFPVSMMQKREEDFLGQVDEYCSDNLLKRLNDAGGVADVAQHTHVMMAALGNAMSQNQGDLLEGLKDAQARMAEVHAEQVAYFQSVNTAMDEQSATHIENVEASLSKLIDGVQASVVEMANKVNALVDSQVKSSVQVSEKHQKNVEGLVKQLSEPIGPSVAVHVDSLTQGLERLNKVLADLGEKHVVIQQQPKRGLFGRKKS
jgi:biopolymer transport protein ExbB/TolQ